MDKFYAKILDIKEVDPRLAEIAQLLRSCPSDEERIAILEAKILQLLNAKRTDIDDVIKSLNIIEQKQGFLNIADLLETIHMSPKTLERKFRNIIGMTHKNYILLIRFQNTLKKVRSDQGRIILYFLYMNSFFNYVSYCRRDLGGELWR